MKKATEADLQVSAIKTKESIAIFLYFCMTEFNLSLDMDLDFADYVDKNGDPAIKTAASIEELNILMDTCHDLCDAKGWDIAEIALTVKHVIFLEEFGEKWEAATDKENNDAEVDRLTEEYQKYLALYGLPQMSADELLANLERDLSRDVTLEQFRADKKILNDKVLIRSFFTEQDGDEEYAKDQAQRIYALHVYGGSYYIQEYDPGKFCTTIENNCPEGPLEELEEALYNFAF